MEVDSFTTHQQQAGEPEEPTAWFSVQDQSPETCRDVGIFAGVSPRTQSLKAQQAGAVMSKDRKG
jgi:hypothetical protein